MRQVCCFLVDAFWCLRGRTLKYERNGGSAPLVYRLSGKALPSSHALCGEGLKASKPETTLKTRHLTAVLIEDVDRAGVYGGSLRATASARRY